ncbi:MAG: hypothetical protein JO308_17635 [Verrucomicrobia bacterium]|nr:hypothetical protein [Verrucomicrobiota bacterium]
MVIVVVIMIVMVMVVMMVVIVVVMMMMVVRRRLIIMMVMMIVVVGSWGICLNPEGQCSEDQQYKGESFHGQHLSAESAATVESRSKG